MVVWFIEDQKIKGRGWRKEQLRQTMPVSESILFEKSLKIKPIKIKTDELWSIDFIWVNATIIGSMLSPDEISTATIDSSTKDLKNQLVYPIIVKFDIDKGKVFESKNITLAKVAYEIGIKRVPVAIFNYQKGKIINSSIHTKERYNHYWKFSPYVFDSPEGVMTGMQKVEWRKQAYLINKRQLFANEEWQDLRKSFLKTWNVTPEQNIRRLRAYLGDFKDVLRVLRVKYYLDGDGFKPGIIEHATIDKLKEELSHHFI
jgi:hypothetical protein